MPEDLNPRARRADDPCMITGTRVAGRGRYTVRTRLMVVSVLAAVALLGLPVPAHAAATTTFVGQFSPASLPEGTSFALTGDQVTAFGALLYPTACTSGSPRTTSDYFQLSLPSGADVQLSGGSFTVDGTASSEYGAGPSTAPYGGRFTMTGTVNAAHTLVTATVALSGAQDPFLSGCSGTYRFIAIPDVTAGTTAPDKAAYQSQFLSFDYTTGVIKNLQVRANFQCGTSVDSAVFTGNAYGYPAVHVAADGAFSIHSYVQDEYREILQLTVSGTVGKTSASGRIVVSEPPGGYELIGSVGVCAGDYRWTATKPVPAPSPGPSAYFQWEAIRIATGASWRYYFAVDQLQCTDHATEVRITVAARTTTIPCSRTTAFASGPLTPSQTYTTTSQALRLTRGRIVTRGTAVTAVWNMPGPGDSWTPIAGLPGTPPG